MYSIITDQFMMSDRDKMKKHPPPVIRKYIHGTCIQQVTKKSKFSFSYLIIIHKIIQPLKIFINRNNSYMKEK